MLDPDFAFSTAGLLAIIGWAGLVLATFLAAARPAVLVYTQLVVPLLIGAAYVILIAAGWGQTHGGGFGSIAEVRALFQNDAALAAGWLHYLAFDLFIGAWILREGLARGVPRPLLLPCYVLTFLFGPAGLLLFLLLRMGLGQKSEEMPA